MGSICALYADEKRHEAWEIYVANTLWATVKSVTGGKYSVQPYSDIVAKLDTKKVNDDRSAKEILSSLTAKMEVSE